jgi:hypothetical protein
LVFGAACRDRVRQYYNIKAHQDLLVVPKTLAYHAFDPIARGGF